MTPRIPHVRAVTMLESATVLAVGIAAILLVGVYPRISIGSVEAVWLTFTLAGAAITWWALRDALQDLDAIQHLNGDIRSINARGNVRRETVRFFLQAVYLGLAIPALFSTAEIRLTPFLAGLMSLPALQLVNTASDYIDRRRIARKLMDDMVAARLKAQA